MILSKCDRRCKINRFVDAKCRLSTNFVAEEESWYHIFHGEILLTGAPWFLRKNVSNFRRRLSRYSRKWIPIARRLTLARAHLRQSRTRVPHVRAASICFLKLGSSRTLVTDIGVDETVERKKIPYRGETQKNGDEEKRETGLSFTFYVGIRAVGYRGFPVMRGDADARDRRLPDDGIRHGYN